MSLLEGTDGGDLDPAPFFSSIILGDESASKLRLLLGAGVPFTDVVATGSMIANIIADGSASDVLEPGADTESLSLLICPASMGDVDTLQLLLDAG